MSAEVKALMEGKPDHWTQHGLCRGDDRFTGRFEDLTPEDDGEMMLTCIKCPVITECAHWARSGVTDVFAAGKWRHPPDE